MRLARDIVAGTVSSLVAVVAGLVATPVYLSLLGQEAYGIVGFYITLQTVLTVLDLGLPVTLNRLVAKDSARNAPTPIACGIIPLFWSEAAVLLVVLAASSAYLAHHWLRLVTLEPGYVMHALTAMAIALAARWPIAAYVAVLMGAKRIVLASGISIAMAVLTPAGAIVGLWWLHLNLTFLFGWYAACGFAQAVWLHAATRDLRASKARSGTALRSFVRESLPVAGTGVVGLLFNQADKAILSYLVPLDAFGHYVLAGLIAGVMYAAVTPVSNALYPRFSELEACGRWAELRRLYRISCHGLAAALFPAALFLIVSGQALVSAWTQDPEVARSVAPLLGWLAAGAALHSVMFATYAFSQAVRLERLVLRINVQALLVSLPLTCLLAVLRGAEGAAQAWFLSHAAYFAASAWQTHRRALPNEAAAWLIADIGVPALACLAIGCFVTAFVPMQSLGTIAQLSLGACAALAALALTLVASSRLRDLVRRLVGKRPRSSESALL